MRDIELRLIGHQSPDGTLRWSDNVALTEAVHTLVYRLTREVVEKPGLGRAARVVERLSEVRVGLETGSTRMVFTVGDEELVIDDQWAEEVDRSFWSLVESMNDNVCPPGTLPTIAAAMDDFVNGITRAAPKVEISIAGHEPILTDTRRLSRQPWQDAALRPTEERQVTGELQMVDLHSAHFRLQDLVGNRIELIDVLEPQQAAPLIGQRVTATGLFTIGDGQRRSRLEKVTVTAAAPLEGILAVPREVDLGALLAEAAALPPLAPMELPDDEFEAFLAAIHE